MAEGFSITFICEFCRSERRARELKIGPTGEQACSFCMCGTEKCRERASDLVHWPGKEIRLCVGCVVRARSIADAMGFTLSSSPILMPIVALLVFLAGCSILTAGELEGGDAGAGDAAADVLVAGDTGTLDAGDAIAAAVDSSPAPDSPPILEDAGPDAPDVPPAPTWRAPATAEALELGVVCNEAEVLVRDGSSAGLARTPVSSTGSIDAVPVSACVVAAFSRGRYVSIRVVARAADSVCGESCSPGFCGTGRELEVFADDAYVGTVAVGGELLEHVLPVDRSIAIVTLCRGGHGYARDHLEIDSVEALR